MATDETGSDDENPSGIPGTANPGNQVEPPYQIMRQYLKDLSFENPNAPQIFARDTPPQVEMNLDIQTNSLGGRDVEVVIQIEARARQEDQVAYMLEMAYAAIVRVGQIPKQALNALLYVEIPRMLFPFVREAVCDATRSGGFSMLLLAPFDFTQLYRARLAQEKVAQEQESPPAETNGDS